MAQTIPIVDHIVNEVTKGEVLFRGKLDWTLNEDSMEVLDTGTLDVGTQENVLICVRNGSPTVDLVVNVGHMAACYPATTSPTGAVAVTDTTAGATKTFTAAAHGLHIGDAVVFTGDGGGVTAGTVYYVITTADADTFQVSTTRGGSAFAVDADDETNSVSIAQEFFALSNGSAVTTIAVPKFAAGTSVAPVAGLVVAVVQGWTGGRLMVEKSAATAAAFSCYVEIRRA